MQPAGAEQDACGAAQPRYYHQWTNVLILQSRPTIISGRRREVQQVGGTDVWCSYPNLILAPILCYGIINELTILIITTVEVKICYSWNVDLIGSAVRRWRVSAIVLSQDVVEPSSNLRLRSKDCLLEVHQLVPYCSGLFNFDINTT